ADTTGMNLHEAYTVTLEKICDEAPITVRDYDPFPDRVCGLAARRNFMYSCASKVYSRYSDIRAAERAAWKAGAFRAEIDFDHITPKWDHLIEQGYAGLEKLHRNKSGEYYALEARACAAVCRLFARFADEYEKIGADENTAVCRRLALGAPETLHDALALIFLSHQLMDSEIMSICSLGGLDRLLDRFYKNDLEQGRITRDDAVNLFAAFFTKYNASLLNNPKPLASYLGKSCFIGGLDGTGDVTNETTYIVIDATVRADVLSPKLAIRLSEKTPDALYDRIVKFIRDENGHAVLCSDEAAMKALVKAGISESDALEYVPIGCYEPAVLGREVGCTGSTSLNIAKAVELALNSGIDPMSGHRLGCETEAPEAMTSFEKLLDAVKAQLNHLIDSIANTINTYEKHYREISPAPLLSAASPDCYASGKHLYAGGLPYNNTACNCGSIGSCADMLHVIRTYVYERKELTLSKLAEILKNNWEGHEELRAKILSDRQKWGNNIPEIDRLASDIARHCSDAFAGRPNGRGGVFKAGLYSIDRAYYFGHATGATADGRLAGTELSKNLGAMAGMEYGGVTAEILSVGALDLTGYPNGSVLDLMLHPSAVSGENGADVLISLIKTYMKSGGFGIQFNVFDAETLRAAQNNPDKYRNLQIRICGWNVYFVRLTREQQETFIKQAELK
nr:hypothetical protein [Clostridia bacterium]